MQECFKYFILLLISYPICCFSWSGHNLLTYISLKDTSLLNDNPTIPAETLSSFLKKEQQKLAIVLKNNEDWATKHIPTYPSLPDYFMFDPAKSKDSLVIQFLKSIRINPELQFPLFVQYTVGVPHRIHRPMNNKKILLSQVNDSPWIYIFNPPFEQILPGEKLSPLEIITSASDEPDYGMDIMLWENSNTWYGLLYKWGKQPFGVSNLTLSSQSPFHMGFYHERAIYYKLGSYIKRVYPEYRIHLFLELSKLAFNTGHPYWGYRFLGWAIHYVQDLTQPYHSTVAPGVPMTKIFLGAFFNALGEKNYSNHIVQLIGNKHFSLENYEVFSVAKILSKKQFNTLLIKRISDESQDAKYPPYSDTYLRDTVSAESHAMANTLYKAIIASFPNKYISDLDYQFYITEPKINLLSIVEKNPNPEIVFLDKQLEILLGNCGAHTRNVIRYILGNGNFARE